MKRDMRIVRALLEYYEDDEQRRMSGILDDFTDLALLHTDMLHHAGFLVCVSGKITMTWRGYDLLDSLRAKDPAPAKKATKKKVKK